jgi:acetoin utilization deacetylase AcuC-like enzyme
MTIITDPQCTSYATPGHPERPARIRDTVTLLKAQNGLPIQWAAPVEAPEHTIHRAHVTRHMNRLLHPVDFDADTAFHNGIGDRARASVGGALKTLECALAGEPSFSLMRPPGHHATSTQAMGFCYLNSMAITALEAHARTGKRVAVFDFDVHHGNGTEEILLNRPGVAFYSIHQSPCYPGTGNRNHGHNCFNYPVAPMTPREEYRDVLRRALDDLLAFNPAIIGISAGFDAYAHDPIAQETLEMEDFHWLGRQLGETGVPSFSILEGGYSNDLPELILAYLKGIAEGTAAGTTAGTSGGRVKGC